MSSGRQARPDRVERLEPVEEVGILRGRDGAREGLVEVVVGVDQPGQDDAAAQVEDFVGRGGQFGGRADLLDDPVPREQPAVRDLAALRVHRHQDGCIFDQETGHIPLLSDHQNVTSV